MAATTITNVEDAQRTIWETKVLEVAEGMFVAEKFAQTKIIGKGAGGTWTVTKLLRVAPDTSSKSFGALVAGSAAKNLVSNKIEITPELWQASFGFDDDVDIKTFYKDSDYIQTIGQHMANTLDKELIKTISVQCMRHRIDIDAGTNTESGPVTNASSTTVFGASGFTTRADDYWNGGFCTVVNPSGEGYDETKKISDYDDAGGVSDREFTTAAFTNALGTTSNIHVVRGDSLAASDKLTSDGLLAVAGLHRKLETIKFPGGILHGFIDAAQEADLWSDDDFKGNASFDTRQRYSQYRLVRWLDQELLVSSNIYREDVVGAAADAGVVYVAPIFGVGSYCLIRWGTPGAGSYGVKFMHVTEPDSGNLTMNERYISWKTSIGKKVLRSTSIIGLMTGATDQNLLTGV